MEKLCIILVDLQGLYSVARSTVHKIVKQVLDIVTRYGLDGPGIKSRWGGDFPHPSRTTMRPTQPSVHGTPTLPGVKRVGRRVDHPIHLGPRLKEEESYTRTSPLRLHDFFHGELYL